ncbi:MAG: hypothetical protein ACREOM_02610 [Candidatus Dormibacteraceae bacterium]
MSKPRDPSARPVDFSRGNSAKGQAMEFRVWTELIVQSGGLLHIFLPLLDSGLDAVIHRLTDGRYIGVQVKGRTEATDGGVLLSIRGDSLVDDRAVIIAGLLTKDGLGPTLLVVDEGTFKSLAGRQVIDGIEVFEARFSEHPTEATRWRPYLVPRESLGTALLGSEPVALEPAAANVELKPVDRHNQWLGFLGEAEVIRRLAESSRFDLFRPFPDLEMVEVLARDTASGQYAGLQVKTAVPEKHGEAQVHIRKATLVPSASTWVVVLAWLPELSRFADECLLIPTLRLPGIAEDAGDRVVLWFNPSSRVHTPLDPFRQRLSDLGALIAAITQSAPGPAA